MLRLDGWLDIDVIRDIQQYTNLRFKDMQKFRTPESLVIYEQRYLDNDVLLSICSSAVNMELYEPIAGYVPEHLVNSYVGTGLVPVVYYPMDNIVECVYLPEEIEYKIPTIVGHTTKVTPTTLHYYMTHYQKHFGKHPDLQEIPPKLLLDMIVKEGIALGAADITLSSAMTNTMNIYYNVRKRKVDSARVVPTNDMMSMIQYLCIQSAYNTASRDPKYVDVDLNRDYRGRCVINRTKFGHSITIRLLPERAFDRKLTDLNLTNEAVSLIRDQMFDMEVGLRLFVGATMSGKNTDALAALNGIVQSGRYKVVSVEMPVEQKLPGVEQINTESLDEYKTNIESLIHQNPDFVYITEIRDSTGLATIRISNTGKRVLSTLHSNGVADTIPRLADITNLSYDRIIQTLHSICYQELVRDEEEDKVYPRIRFLRFTDEIKDNLYGKSLGEILKYIKQKEVGDEW